MSAVIRRESVEPLRSGFNFIDIERQARDILAAAERDARQRLDAAQAQADALVAANRRAGYDAGFAEGRKAAIESAEAKAREAASATAQRLVRDEISALERALRAAIVAFDASKRRLLSDAEAGLIDLAMAIARRVCKTLAATTSDVALANARALLDLVRRNHDVELTLHPDDYAALQVRLPEIVADAAQRDHVRFVADAAVERGGCVLRSPDAVIDATLQTQLDRVAEACCGGGECESPESAT